MNDKEKEVLLLLAVVKSIGAIVNCRNFDIKINEKTNVATINLVDDTSEDIILIRSIDLISPAGNVVGKKSKSVIKELEEAFNKPNFDQYYSENLLIALKAFLSWLDENQNHKMNLSISNCDTDVLLRNRFVLEICGNVVKHNFTRLDRTQNKLKKVLIESGLDETVVESKIEYLLDDVSNHFLGDGKSICTFIYDIAYYLNNIRFAIYEYLEFEYSKSYTETEVMNGFQHYKFTYPNDINGISKKRYWELMEWCRSGYKPKCFILYYHMKKDI